MMFEWRLKKEKEGECSEAASILRFVSILACNAVKSVITVPTASSITERMAEQGAN